MQPSLNTSHNSKRIYDFCRYFVAFMILCYGWAKIMGSQFTILDSELDKPMGEVSGFWLTWYYFGYSPIYGNFIAVIQIVSGFLLLWRKTVLLASCVLFGVIGNIVLIDIFYGVDLGALVMAMLLAIGLLVIILHHKDELINVFWITQNSLFSTIGNKKKIQLLKVALVSVFVILPPSLTYYIANFNNRFPTEIDGKWKVSTTSLRIVNDEKPLTKLYFERNRAFMSVFRFGENQWITHHFEIDSETKEIRIWEKWLSKGTEIFEGKYRLSDEKMILDGILKSSNQPVKIELERE